MNLTLPSLLVIAATAAFLMLERLFPAGAEEKLIDMLAFKDVYKEQATVGNASLPGPQRD